MNFFTRWTGTALLAGVLGISSTAMATTGYFSLGHGAKSMGLAGATVSNPQDSLAAASNPAGMSMVGERADVGVHFFNPVREAELTTSDPAVGASYDVDAKSRRNLFLVPSIGFTKQVSKTGWWGISAYARGGMNTTYDRNIYDEALAAGPATTEGDKTGTPNTGTLGVDLAQLVIAPTAAFKVHDKHTLGLSYLIGIQRFSARGLGNFQGFTSSPPSDKLTNNGNDWSYGSGVRVGWIGEVSPKVTLGAAVSSKIYMSAFDDYEELFAEEGDFDIPANASAGITVAATPKMKVSLDYQRIFYEGIKSVSNPGPLPGFAFPPGGDFLGRDNGLGFGWEDINVYRLAMEYNHNAQWIYRAGLALNDQPIPDDQVLFNIIAPGVMKKHVTLGFTYLPNKTSEWSFALMHAPKEEVNTPLTAFGIPAEISMYQNSVDLSYALKF